MVYLKMVFFSWPRRIIVHKNLSISKENNRTATLKTIIFHFSGNVPVLYKTWMKRSNSIWLVADDKEVIEDVQTFGQQEKASS
jgi:hypothetical protein